MSEDSCCPYDWPIWSAQLYFSGLPSFCLLMQYLFPERKQQINFASLCSLHIFRDFLQNPLHCSTLFIQGCRNTEHHQTLGRKYFLPTM